MAHTATVPLRGGPPICTASVPPGARPPWWGEPVRRPAPNRPAHPPRLPWSADARGAARPTGRHGVSLAGWPGGAAALLAVTVAPPGPRRPPVPAPAGRHVRFGGAARRRALLVLAFLVVVLGGPRRDGRRGPPVRPRRRSWPTHPRRAGAPHRPTPAATTDAPTLVGVVHGAALHVRGRRVPARLRRGGPAARRPPRWPEPLRSGRTRLPVVRRHGVLGARRHTTRQSPSHRRAPSAWPALAGSRRRHRHGDDRAGVRRSRRLPRDQAGRVLVLAVPYDGGAAAAAGGRRHRGWPGRSATHGSLGSRRGGRERPTTCGLTGSGDHRGRS